MTEDEKFIERRRAEDARTWLTTAMDPDTAPRQSPALIAIRKTLSAEGPTPHAAVLAAGLRASDLAVTTVDNLLRELVRAGMVHKIGAYSSHYDRRKQQRIAHDTRVYLLGDWA